MRLSSSRRGREITGCHPKSWQRSISRLGRPPKTTDETRMLVSKTRRCTLTVFFAIFLSPFLNQGGHVHVDIYPQTGGALLMPKPDRVCLGCLANVKAQRLFDDRVDGLARIRSVRFHSGHKRWRNGDRRCLYIRHGASVNLLYSGGRIRNTSRPDRLRASSTASVNSRTAPWPPGCAETKPRGST